MSEQHEYIFFTDRDLGNNFPAKLKEAGIVVTRHCDHFADDAKDEEWLREVGKNGWYVLTHDRRIRYKPNEKDAVKKFQIGLFIIVGQAAYDELANNFIKTLHKIKKFINKHPRPFIAKIYRPSQNKKTKSGNIEMWEPF